MFVVTEVRRPLVGVASSEEGVVLSNVSAVRWESVGRR